METSDSTYPQVAPAIPVGAHRPVGREDLREPGGPSKDGAIDGHLLDNYDNIFDIKKGEAGYVAPRNDKPNEGN